MSAPLGLIDYCARTQACTGAEQGPGQQNGMELPDKSRDQAFRVGGRDQSGATARFALMLAGAAGDVRVDGPRIEATLTQARWRELVLINRVINRAIRPASDQVQYGVVEHWETPILEAVQGAAAPRGDCEDYALEKRARLLAAGWSEQAVALAIARLPSGLHTVLIVQTDLGDFILDNLHATPQPVAGLDYVWVSRQAGPALTHWAEVRVAASSTQGAFVARGQVH